MAVRREKSSSAHDDAMEARKREFDAKRRAANRQKGANLLGMASNPGALLRGAADIPGSVYRYLRGNEPVEIGEDVSNLASSMAADFRKDPVKFAVDMVNPVTSVQDFADIRALARDLRAAGDLDKASMLEQVAAMSPLAMVPVVGKVLSKSAKIAAKTAAKKVASLAAKKKPTALATRVESKLPVQLIPEAANAPDLNSLRVILSNPETNPAARAATDYTQATFGRDYDPMAVKPPASLEKQSGIARTFRAGVEGDPAYKHAVFERYGQVMPEAVERAKAQNYDQLTEAAYRQLAKETRGQFDAMPVATVMHTGEGDYGTPSAMIRDVLAKGQLKTFRGGDPHPYLGAVDPDTGLTSNEMFRAIHDYFGHVPQGNTFRAAGEEAAYGSHSQMMSPLAQAALAAETRGQNSFVNYSPLNAKIVGEMENIKAQLDVMDKAKLVLQSRPSWHHEYAAAQKLLANADDPKVLKARLRELGGQWQYAPQTPLLLPPEHVAVDTKGGIPDYVRRFIVPRKGTEVSARGVHMSQSPDLEMTDPSFFGAGHRGVEYADVASGRFGAPKRTYFYAGPEGTVNPERVLFARGERTPYEANLSGLYDAGADPEGLVALVRARQREGLPNNQLDRIVREYGYKGLLGGGGPEWEAGQRAAAVFDPVRVRRLAVKPGHKGYAKGGAVH